MQASRCRDFELAFEAIDQDFAGFLKQVKLDAPATWAHLVPKSTLDAGMASDFLEKLLGELGVPPDKLDDWAAEAHELWLAAYGEKADLALRVGRLSGLHLSADACERQAAKQGDREAADLLSLIHI